MAHNAKLSNRIVNPILSRVALRAFVALVVAALIFAQARDGFGALAAAQDFKKFNQFVQTSDSPSTRLLREGRNLLDGEEWAKAAAKFGQFLSAYPRDRDMDVALYWLAYSLKKQEKYREAMNHLARLLTDCQRSAWADEATAMLTELAPRVGDTQTIERSLKRDDEELKIVALQSLFEANPARASAYVADILKPGSTASQSFKEAAVSLLGSRGGKEAVPVLLEIARSQPDRKLRMVAIRRLSDEGGEAVIDDLMRLFEAERDAEVKAQILRVFADVESPRATAKLVEIARDQNHETGLRLTAIRVLGEDGDAAPFDTLMQIYQADARREIKEQIIRALAEMENPAARAKLLEIARSAGSDTELRKTAIRRLVERESDATIDELMGIYTAERDMEVKQQILRAFGDMNNTRARAKLAEAARGESDLELRKTAIRRLGESDDTAALDLLLGLYDAERSVEIKEQLLRAFGESKQKRALQKLMDVARRDSSIALRKTAIRMLGESDDPEALKLLEELLKP
ncbi:MAG: HEAT repeat domain-containing protein [Pyrinomonadaceae bacterium]